MGRITCAKDVLAQLSYKTIMEGGGDALPTTLQGRCRISVLDITLKDERVSEDEIDP